MMHMMNAKHFLEALCRRKSSAILLLPFLLLLTTMMAPADAGAQYRGGRGYRSGLYGQFCDGSHRGGPFGTRNPVTTVEQARQVIEKCLALRGQGLHTGTTFDRAGYFELEVLGGNGLPVDRVIVHKRSGRVRSIYEPRDDTRYVREVLDAKE